tara:strand:- start:327 stop:977 length:651 start_codon:yes stop_codon:yes gene_type:complete
MSQNRLKEIIIKNKLCISENPNGIDKLWPKSYIEKFYERQLNYQTLLNKRTKILDFNPTNKYQTFLWENYFSKKVSITNVYVNKENTFNSIRDKLNAFYNIIIINEFQELFSLGDIKYLLRKLEDYGFLAIEDIGCKSLYALNLFINLFLNYDISIKDYRLHKFIRNNCLLLIKKPNKNILLRFLTIIINIIRIMFYLINEILILVLDLYKKFSLS